MMSGLNTTHLSRPKLTVLQILRGFAASIVVFYHFALEGGRYSRQHSWINSVGLGTLGESGVDLFFVISGFIMVYTTIKYLGSSDAVLFLKKRAIRIYPLYWLWTTFLFLLWKLHIALASHRYSTSFIVKSYLLIPVSNGVDLHPFLNQGWTLNFEVLFYVLFALGILWCTPRFRVPLVVMLLIGCFELSSFLPKEFAIQQLLASRLLFEFAFGMSAGWICLWASVHVDIALRHRVAQSLSVLGAILLLGAMHFVVNDSNRCIFYGIPSFLIVLGATLWKERTYHPFLVFLGDASYSIYLIHGIIILVFSNLMKHGGLLQRIPLDLLIIVGTFCVIPLTSLGYIFVERPFVRLLERFPATP